MIAMVLAARVQRVFDKVTNSMQTITAARHITSLKRRVFASPM